MNLTFVVKYLMKNETSKAILNQFMRERNLMNVIFVVKYLMKNKTQKSYWISSQEEETLKEFESIWVFYYLRCPECEFKTKEENDFENHAIKKHPMYVIATKDFMENKTSKAILNQFMRGRNLMIVIFVVKYLMKYKSHMCY